MSEPSIDEILEWLSHMTYESYKQEPNYIQAIRSILEQHRNAPAIGTRFDFRHMRQVELEAIRAFVERVQRQVEGSGLHYQAMMDELAAMENASKT